MQRGKSLVEMAREKVKKLNVAAMKQSCTYGRQSAELSQMKPVSSIEKVEQWLPSVHNTTYETEEIEVEIAVEVCRQPSQQHLQSLIDQPDVGEVSPVLEQTDIGEVNPALQTKPAIERIHDDCSDHAKQSAVQLPNEADAVSPGHAQQPVIEQSHVAEVDAVSPGHAQQPVVEQMNEVDEASPGSPRQPSIEKTYTTEVTLVVNETVVPSDQPSVMKRGNASSYVKTPCSAADKSKSRRLLNFKPSPVKTRSSSILQMISSGSSPSNRFKHCSRYVSAPIRDKKTVSHMKGIVEGKNIMCSKQKVRSDENAASTSSEITAKLSDFQHSSNLLRGKRANKGEQNLRDGSCSSREESNKVVEASVKASCSSATYKEKAIDKRISFHTMKRSAETRLDSRNLQEFANKLNNPCPVVGKRKKNKTITENESSAETN
jgi:hypothetical protein